MSLIRKTRVVEVVYIELSTRHHMRAIQHVQHASTIPTRSVRPSRIPRFSNTIVSPRYQITPNQYTVSRGKVQMQGSNHLCILIGSYQIMSRCTSEITLEYL